MAELHELEAVRSHRVLFGDGGRRRIVRERSHGFPPVVPPADREALICENNASAAWRMRICRQAASGWLAGAASWKALMLGAGRIHRGDLRISVERNVEAPRIEDLRHEIDIGERDPGAEGDRVPARSALSMASKPSRTQWAYQASRRGLIVPEPLLEVGERAGIVERVDIAADQAGNGPHLGAVDRTDRQQGRLRIDLVEIFEDGRRLDQRRRRRYRGTARAPAG